MKTSSKTLFYLVTLFGSIILFASFGFLPTDCISENSNIKDCTIVEFNEKLMILKNDCSWNGLPLYGKIKFVESFPDIKIQYVESFPDLKVKFVDSFPNNCGEWQIVKSFPDIKVQVVESFPDIKVKVVESFPEMPN